MDADAHLERAVRFCPGEGRLHGQSSAHRLLGVILMRVGGTKDSHDGVANMFLNPSSSLLDDGVQPRPDRNHLLANLFRVPFSRESGEPGEIGEQHCHLFAFAPRQSLARLRTCNGLSARRTELCGVRKLLLAVRTARYYRSAAGAAEPRSRRVVSMTNLAKHISNDFGAHPLAGMHPNTAP